MTPTIMWLLIICLGILFVNEHFTSKRLYKQLKYALRALQHEVKIKELAIQISEEILDKMDSQERELVKLRKINKLEDAVNGKKILVAGKYADVV
jgi:predicted Holliday junction resolvase-like endonuclease